MDFPSNKFINFGLIYLYKEDLALNKLKCLICYKTKPNQTFVLIDWFVYLQG